MNRHSKTTLLVLATSFAMACSSARRSKSSSDDGTDGADGTAAADAADAADGTDGTVAADATDGSDGTDAADGSTVSDATDGSTDATDGTSEATDAVDGTDGTTDATDGTTDATDGTSDGIDGGPIGCTVPENIAALINSKCGGCHTGGGASGGFKFDPADAIANTVGVPAKGGDGILIVAGAANESYLIQKLNGTGAGSKMPLGGSLSAAEIAQFSSWIDALQCDSTDGVDGVDGVDGTTDATDGTDGADGGFLPAGCLNAGAQCNPITNGGCTGDGEACDISSDGLASCFPPPNDVALGGACDNASGPFCQGGMHCNGQTAKCEKFCCSSTDCTGGLTCVQIDPNFGAVGTCSSAAPPVP